MIILAFCQGVRHMILNGPRALRTKHSKSPAYFGHEAQAVRIESRTGRDLFARYVPAAKIPCAPVVPVMIPANACVTAWGKSCIF
jgi:hypothetical protein